MFSGILFLHLRGVLCCASQSGLRECLYNVWQLHVREKVISRRFPPVTKVKLNGVFHPIQRTLVFTTKFILALLQQPQKAVALMVWKMCNSVSIPQRPSKSRSALA